MNPTTLAGTQGYILYDADRLSKIDDAWFEPERLRAAQRLTGEARGRGTTWFCTGAGLSLVLRHYRRGGWLAGVLGDRYLWCGLRRSRAWREWRLLAHLYERGLPVPAPVAARVQRRGPWYTADLLTQRIENTETLAQRLCSAAVSESQWSAIGAAVRVLHGAGADHADLNAHNILLGADGRVYVIDFDKGRLRVPPAAGTAWPARNLARLRRSLDKLSGEHAGFAFAESDWVALCCAYGVAPG